VCRKLQGATAATLAGAVFQIRYTRRLPFDPLMTDESSTRFAPLIIAHRGARIEAPENTAAAFERAIDYPIDGVEFDVQMSADAVPVLFHDKTLKKITGTRKQVADLPWKTLETLDAGAWFGPSFAGEPLLTLQRLLEMFAGRTRLFIEIKVFAADRRSGRTAQLIDTVLGALADPRHAACRGSFSILSFDAQALVEAWHRAPDLAYVLDVAKADVKRLPALPSHALECLHGFCVHCGGISPSLVRWAHGLEKQVSAYTCNDPATLEKMREAGVDGILTDDPGWLVRQMKPQ
jgi:glycerophosphoryl diester phosphodiesterase